MSRYFFILLFLLVLLAPFAAQRALTHGRASAGTSGAGVRLVVVTPHNQDIRREFARAFAAWHREKFGQDVQIDFRTPGGTNDIVRLLSATYAAMRTSGKLPPEDTVRVDIDVAWGGGDYMYDHDLKPLGILQPIEFDDPTLLAEAFPEKTLAGVKLYEETVVAGRPAPRWVGICLSSFGIVYNPDLYTTLGLPPPTRWQDLADPRLSGWVALADPTHSGSVAVAYMMVLQRAMADAESAYRAAQGGAGQLNKADPAYQSAIAAGWHRGMGQLLLIAANAHYFTDSGTQPPNDVGNGEAAVGIAIDFYGRTFEQEVGSNRIRFIAPKAATAITPDPVALLYGVKGDRQTLGRHFVQFLLTRQGQSLWVKKAGTPGGPVDRSLHRSPIRRDLYGPGQDQTDWADHLNPFDDASGFNQRGEWMGLLTDVRPIWAAAWIDDRDSLRSAYEKVLLVKDEASKAKLLAELADLPIQMGDVALLRDKRKELEAKGADVDLYKAEQRQHWAAVFRDHYAAVAAKARSAGQGVAR